MLTCMQLNTFVRQVQQMVSKYSHILRIWCMEGRKGHFQFHTFGRRLFYRWYLTMQCMQAWPKLSNYRRRCQKWYSMNCGHNGHVYKTIIRTLIHFNPFILQPLSWWCIFLKHKIHCWPSFSALIEWQYVLCIPTVHFVSNNLTLR